MNIQLQWYHGDMILQDHELLHFVQHNKINKIKYIGDSKYLEDIIGKKHSDIADMCIYLVNSFFDIQKVLEICNQEIRCLPKNGIFYLSLNKFLLQSAPQQQNIDANYDFALRDFVIAHVHFPLLRYYSGAVDGGQRFNWVHPLTRFYFTNENINLYRD
jgi:hypothetical protein